MSRWIRSAGILVVVSLFVLSAGISTSAWWLTRHSTKIEQWLSTQTGMQIRMDSLRWQWHGIAPSLQVNAMRIDSGDRGSVYLNQLELRFSWLRSIANWSLSLERLIILEPRAIIKVEDIRQNLPKWSSASSSDPVFFGLWNEIYPFLRVVGGIDIQDFRLDIQAGDQIVSLPPLHVTWRTSSENHVLKIFADPSVVNSDPVILSAFQFYGPLSDPFQWRSELDAQVRDWPMPDPSWQEGIIPKPWALSFNVDGVFSGSDGNLDMPVCLLNLPDSTGGSLSLKAHISIAWGEKGMQLEIEHMTAQDESRQQEILSGASFSLSSKGSRLMEVEHLNLGGLTMIATSIPALSAFIGRALMQVSPVGSIDGLRVFDSPGPGFEAEGLIREVGWSAEGDIPSVQGLNGHFQWSDNEGILTPDDTPVRIHTEAWHDNPFPLSRVTGSLHLLKHQYGWRVEGRDLYIITDDFEFAGDFATYSDVQRHWWLELEVSGHGGMETREVLESLPDRVFSSELMSWLHQSLKGGEVTGVHATMHGLLKDFPYRDHPNRFLIEGEWRNGALAYASSWPELEHVNARLVFRGPSIRVNAQQSGMAGLNVTSLSANIADVENNPTIHIRGQLSGQHENIFGLLHQLPPIGSQMPRWMDTIKAQGFTQTQLDLILPIDDMDRYRLKGNTDWRDVSLDDPDHGISLRDINGHILFTDESLSAQNISGRWYEKPFYLQIQSQYGKKKFLMDIDGEGTVDLVDVQDRLPGELQSLIGGRFQWRGHMRLDQSQSEQLKIKWQVDSPLFDAVVDLPPPFGKKEAQRRFLHLGGEWSVLQPFQWVQASYGQGQNKITAISSLQPSDGRWTVSGVKLGFGEVPLSRPEPVDGLQIYGKIHALNLDAYLPWMFLWMEPHRGQAEPNVTQWIKPLGIDLFLDQTTIAGLTAKDLHFQFDGSNNIAVNRFHGGSIEGQTFYTDSRVPIQVDFERVQLDFSVPNSDQKLEPQFKKIPTGLRPIVIAIENLSVNQWQGRNLRLRLYPEEQGLRLWLTSFEIAMMQLHGNGWWLYDPQNEAAALSGTRSGFSLHAHGVQFAETLRQLDLIAALNASKSSVNLNTEWDGAPWDFKLGQAQGELELLLEDGQIYAVDPGGAGRILGILSLYALPRRLAMDFGDIFSDGMSFDRINGTLKLKGGRLTIQKARLIGTIANVMIQGYADLLQKHVDHTLYVHPQWGVGAAIATGAVGGVLMGAGIWVGSQFMQQVIKQELSIPYHVYGSWKNPKVERLNPTLIKIE